MQNAKCKITEGETKSLKRVKDQKTKSECGEFGEGGNLKLEAGTGRNCGEFAVATKPELKGARGF
jgi:hypothetical protein